MERTPCNEVTAANNHHPAHAFRRSYRRRRTLARSLRPVKHLRPRGDEGEHSLSASCIPPSIAHDPDAVGAETVGTVDGLMILAADAATVPAREKHCLAHGSVSVLGRRRDMEDAVAEVTGLAAGAAAVAGYGYFAVYDGHGGRMVAEVCRNRLHVAVEEEVRRRRAAGEGECAEMWRRALAAGFARVEAEVMEATQALKLGTVGSTAVVAVVSERWIAVANCGDSRAVLSRGGMLVPLSIDHKPDRPDELKRVEALGGRILCCDIPRVLGILSTSRSFGDYLLKPYVSADPEITVTDRTEEDEFLILASDGLWDVISSEMACRVTRKCLEAMRTSDGEHTGEAASCAAREAAAVLARLAISRGSDDNVSVVVVELRLSSASQK